MEKNDESLTVDNNAEPELFDMVVECVSDQSEGSQGEKDFEEIDEGFAACQVADLNEPSTSSFGTVESLKETKKRKKITQIIYIEEESESSDSGSSSQNDLQESVQKITIIKKKVPKNPSKNDGVVDFPSIINSPSARINSPPTLKEAAASSILFMQKEKFGVAKDVPTQFPQEVFSLDFDIQNKIESVSEEKSTLLSNLEVDASKVESSVNVMNNDHFVDIIEESPCVTKINSVEPVSSLLGPSEAESSKERSTSFTVGVVHFSKLKSDKLALEVFKIRESDLRHWQSRRVSLSKKYHSDGFGDWERDLFVSVAQDIFEGTIVTAKDLCSRGNGLRSFHMVSEDHDKGLTNDWAIKWCENFEIGFEKDPLDFLQDFEEVPLAYPGVPSAEIFTRIQNGELFNQETQCSWEIDRDMPILEKVSCYSVESVSPKDTCVLLSPVSLANNLDIDIKENKSDDSVEVNNNSLKHSEEEGSASSCLSENRFSEEEKKSDYFRQLVVSYAHENGAKAASVNFEVLEDDVKQWCWSKRYRNVRTVTKSEKDSSPIASSPLPETIQESSTVASIEKSAILNVSHANVKTIDASDDNVKCQRHCASETLTLLSMGLITTRSQQKSQDTKSDSDSVCIFNRSTMKTRNSSRKMDQNSSPNQMSNSRNSSPPIRKRSGSPSSNDNSLSSNKKEDNVHMRLTRQTNRNLLNRGDFDKPSTSTEKSPKDAVSLEKGLSKNVKMKNLIPHTFGYVPTEYSMLHGIPNSVVSSYSLRSKRISKASDGSRKVVIRKSERLNELVKSAFTLRQKVVEYARINGVSAAAENFKMDVGKVRHWSMQSTVQNICQSRLRMSTRGGSNSIFPGPKMIQGQGDTEKMPVFDNYPACFQKRAILLAESKGKDEAAKQFGIPQSVLSEWLASKDSVLSLSTVENVIEWEVDLFIEIHKARMSGIGMTLEELIHKGNSFLKLKNSKIQPKLSDDWAFDFCERFGVTLKEDASDVENETTSECGILNNVGLQRLSINLPSTPNKETPKNKEKSGSEEETSKDDISTKASKLKKSIPPNGVIQKNDFASHRQKYSNTFIDKVLDYAEENSFEEAAKEFIVAKNLIMYWSSKRQQPNSSASIKAESDVEENSEHSSGKLLVTIKKEPVDDDDEKYSVVVPPKIHSTRSSTLNSARTNYAKLNSGRENSPLYRASKKKLSSSSGSPDEGQDEEPKPKQKKKVLVYKQSQRYNSRMKPNNFFQKPFMQGNRRLYTSDFKNTVLAHAKANGIYSAANQYKICSSMITYWDVSRKITPRTKPGLSYGSSVKNDVLEFVKTGSCYDAAIKYRVSPAVVFKWKAEQKKAEEASPNNLALQALNQQMLEWYKDSKLKGNSLRKSIIMTKAKSLSSQLNFLDFKADEEWYKDWMKLYVEKDESERSIERRKSNRKPVPKVQNPNIIYLPTKKRRIEKPKGSSSCSPTNKRRSRYLSTDLQDDSDSHLSTHSYSTRAGKKSEVSEDEECVDATRDSSFCDSTETNPVWLCQEAKNFSSLKKQMTCPPSPNGYSDSNGTDQGENYSIDFKLMVASFAQASDINEAAKKFDLDPELVSDWCERREDLEKAVNPYFKKPEPSKTVVGFFLKWFREINIQSKVLSPHKVLQKVDQIVQKFGGKKRLNSSKWFYKWYDERLEKIRHIPECDLAKAEESFESGSRIRYPAAFKLEFLKYVTRRNPLEACQVFQVSRHLHSHWRKKKDFLEMLCQSGQSECNRCFQNTFVNNDSTEPSDVEEAPPAIDPDSKIHEWYKKYISDNGGPPKFDILKRKAKEIYDGHDLEFDSPSTWYFQFCKSFKISEKFIGDPEMLEFVLKQFDQNVTLSQRDLLNNAIDIIRQKKPNFVGSSGWVHRFIRRYPHLVQEVPSVSEMLPASLETCVTNFRKSMKEIQNEGLFLPLAIGSMDEVPLSFPKINLSGPIRPQVRDCGDKHASGVVMLSCLSDGRILPPLIILKSDTDQEEIDRCSNRLIIYQKDIQVDSDMIIKWLKDVWLCHVPIPNLLVLDYYYPHTSTTVQQFTSESGIRLVIVPGGCSSKLHPVAAGIRRRFEYLIREQWLKHQTKSYKYVVPSAELILEWVTSAHQQLLTETELAKRSFVVTGIATLDDESQDHLVGDESFLFANGRPFL